MPILCRDYLPIAFERECRFVNPKSMRSNLSVGGGNANGDSPVVSQRCCAKTGAAATTERLTSHAAIERQPINSAEPGGLTIRLLLHS
jgi:hypothetical protein